MWGADGRVREFVDPVESDLGNEADFDLELGSGLD